MTRPDPAPAPADDDDEPADGLTTGQWITACAQGDRDWDQYGNA